MSTQPPPVQLLSSLDEVASAEWIPLGQRPQLLLHPALGESGPLGFAPAVPARLAAEVLRWLGRPRGEGTIVVYSGNQVADQSLQRLGYRPQAELSWELLDLAGTPRWAIEHPDLPLPVALPAIAYSAHNLVLLATLGTHPTRRMVGCLEALLGLLPDAGRSDLQAAAPEIAALLVRLWPPNLCILDGRQVRRWDTLEHVDLVAGGPILVGTDPLAMDTAASRLLGLRPRDVPLLAGTRRALHRPWPLVGPLEPFGLPPHPSRHFREARIRAAAGRLLWHVQRRVDRLLQWLDLPRVVGFIHRLEQGQ